MKKSLAILSIVILIISFSVFLYFKERVYEVRLHESDLQKKMESKLPVVKKYFFIFEVRLSEPRVDLIEGSNRFNAGLDVALNIKINNVKKPLGGSVDASGSIRYDPATGGFYVVAPVIESLKIQGLPDYYKSKIEKVVTIALSEYYQDHPVYTLRAEDVKKAAAKLVLKSVAVHDNYLVMKLGL